MKIIEDIFRDNGEHIEWASARWGKGDIPLIKQLDTNYPFEGASNNALVALKDKNFSEEKYYLIMDLIKEVPNLEKIELVPLNNNIDYYIIGANILWRKNKTQSQHHIYLPELYPYHNNNSNVSIVGNKFMVFRANDKAKGLIESILKDVR